MKLKIKDMDISTGGVMVGILHRDDAKKMDLHALDRIKITKGKKSAVAVLDIAESSKAVPPGCIGLFEESLARLHGKDSEMIEISFEKKPDSVMYIKKKLDGQALSEQEIYSIIRDIVENKLTDIELTSFVCASYSKGLSAGEIVALTKSVRDTGEILKFDTDKVMDLHCVGGIAGNRTTLIVVPIVAAAGLIIPKTSSRAITSPSGTADTMEILCNVSLPLAKLRRVVQKTNASIAWGGGFLNLAPADDKIIGIEYPLALEIPGQMLASIIAKKAATSITHLLLDIPVGKSAKVKSIGDARILRDKFMGLAKVFKISLKVVFTDGLQPIGNGIGVALEARDALWILQNDPRGPTDLLKKSLYLAGILLEMGGKAKAGQGEKLAQQILESGRAYQKMVEIINAQGKRATRPEQLAVGKYSYDLKADKAGVIKGINNKSIIRIAKVAGAPDDSGAGVFIHKHLGASVKKGEKLMTIYTHNKEKMSFAKEMLLMFDGFEVG